MTTFLKVLVLILTLAAFQACTDNSEQACAFDGAAEYVYSVVPDGRSQGPSTLVGVLGFNDDAPQSCSGEVYTVAENDVTFTFTVTDTDGEALIVRMSTDGEKPVMLRMVEQ